MESASLPEPNDGGCHTRCVVHLAPKNRGTKRHEQPRQAHVVVTYLSQSLPEYRRKHHRRQWRLSLSFRNRLEVLGNQPMCFYSLEITGNRKNRIVGRIVGREELRHVIERCRG